MIATQTAQPVKNQKVTIYKPLPKSKRIKIHIPYELKTERESFKQLNTSFYHPTQKLWKVEVVHRSTLDYKFIYCTYFLAILLSIATAMQKKISLN